MTNDDRGHCSSFGCHVTDSGDVVGMTMGWWGWCCGVVVVWGGVVVVQLGCSVDVRRLVATLPNGDVAPS